MGILDKIRQVLSGDEPHDAAHAGHHHEGADDEALSEYDGRSLADAYVAALQAQRAEKDFYFQSDPFSPIPHEDRHNWEGLNYFEPDLHYQFTLKLQRTPSAPLVMQTSTGEEQRYQRIGIVRFEVAGESAQLAVYESEEGDLFLPFRDATSGQESYGAGRYLEPLPLGNDELLVDFNLAYNPYCAYSPDFSCPLPPIENWLKVPIRAGEKAYGKDEDGQ